MSETPLDSLVLVVLLAPLLTALGTARPGRSVDERSYQVAWWGFVAGLVAALGVLYQLIGDPTPIRLALFESPWHFLPEIALSVDRLAAVMMVVVTLLGTLLYRFSTRYLQQDPGQSRFHTLLSLAVASLLLMVSSSDLVTLLVCWQLLTWLLALLTHNYSHGPTAQSSFRIFVTLRLGDVAFLAGVALAYELYGTVQFAELFPRAAADQTVFDLGVTSLRGSSAVLLLIFVGAMCKSAQFPFHRWLPDSLYAPTPVSALLHAGIINAGGFLLARLAPLYVISTPTLHLVFWVGLVTLIVGTAMMLVQNDIKKALVYSTVGQMGFMIMECGLGAFALAVFHLMAHGLFKATLFLNSGDVIRQARAKPKKPTDPSSAPRRLGPAWPLGFLASLALPLGILVAVHELLGIQVQEAQGLQIFLFFSWMTASHAMLTMHRVGRTGAMAQGALLAAITLIAAGYLFAAEVFAHFLYIDDAVVQSYFDAAALPEWVFFGMAATTLLLMGAAWVSAYRQGLGDRDRPTQLRTDLYLLFVNGLYLDDITRRAHDLMKRVVRELDGSGYVGIALAVIVTVSIAAMQFTDPASLSGHALLALVCGLALPLFPLHGVYMRVATRTPGATGVLAASAMPLAGLLALVGLLPRVPAGFLPELEVLALGGAAYGSLKALVQPRARDVVAYGGLAVYSILWWHCASMGAVTPSAIVFGASAALALGGLFFACNSISRRFGDLEIAELGGLYRQMPALGLLMVVLIMAAMGLPPFGLFVGFIGMLTAEPEPLPLSSGFIFFAWFAASWYLYRLMQRLLFGPHRPDLRYDDLQRGERTTLALVIGALVIFGLVPHEWAESLVTGLAGIFGGAT